MKDRLNVSTRQRRSIKKCKDSLPIPIELVIEIFSRLPAKSVKKYRFLSKFWFNLIQSQYFIDLFAANSSARLQILFLERNKYGISFSSAHQPSEKSSSDNIVPSHLTHYPISGYATSCQYDTPINGLVCVSEYVGGRMFVPVIYNPSTRDVLNLPKMKETQRICPLMRNFLGYDPTEKQFKVLSIGYYNRTSIDYQVLTLEPKVMSWRMIECCTPHRPMGRGICINGVLYYHALGLLNVQLIVCFEVRSETFRFIKPMESFSKGVPCSLRTLINYDGKLALLIPEKSYQYLYGKGASFEIWVLENHEWSKHGYYVLPPSWKDVVGVKATLMCVGMIGTNEIVLSSALHSFGKVHEHPYIFYYNIEKNTIRRFNIRGMEEASSSRYRHVHMYLNHAEDVSLFKLLH